MKSQIDARERLLADLPVEERRLQLAGIPTVLHEGGGGSPVVLLHGPGGSGLHWMRVIPGLVGTHAIGGHFSNNEFVAPISRIFK